jgi:hypothetical protein
LNLRSTKPYELTKVGVGSVRTFVKYPMSKKHKKASQEAVAASGDTSMHTGEYVIIRHDLIRVLVLNVIYLALVLAVYFTNSKGHYLERIASRMFHF